MSVETYNPFADTRNVADRYKWWEHVDIIDDLDSRRSELVFGFLNTENDMNLSSGIRNAAGFNIKETWVIGRRHWNRVGSVGAHNYIPVKRTPELSIALDELRSAGYRIIGAEISDEAIPLNHYEWVPKSFVLFGQESAGLSDEEKAMCDDIVYIPMAGHIRSFNVSSTSMAFAYDYHMKMGQL